MNRYLFCTITAAACLVASCAAPGGSAPASAAMTAEKAETGAELAYVAVASALNIDEQKPTATPASVAKDEATKLKAWQTLQEVRTLYKAGLDISQVAGSLQGMVSQVGGASAAATATAPK